MKNSLSSLLGWMALPLVAAANPLAFPCYEQRVEAEFASAEAAASATCEVAPLPGDAKVAYSCRWDDYNPAHIAKGEMMNRAGVKGSFYLTGFSSRFKADKARQLMAMGHAIGNHTVRHPKMLKIPANDAFWNIATNRIALEVAIQHPIISYVAPFGWGRPRTNAALAKVLAECLVADGHFVSEDAKQDWSKLPARTWMWTNRFASNDRNPNREAFLKGFQTMNARARRNPEAPRVTLGTHSWCDAAGNARQEEWLKEFFHPDDGVMLNDWQYGAYRYQYFHGGVKKLSSDGNRAVFVVTRYSAALVGDAIPLSLKFSSAPTKVAKDGVALAAGERGTWTLPQDAVQAKLPRIVDGDDSFTVTPDESKATLTLALVNRGATVMENVYLAAALPPKWSERRVTAHCPALKPGETFRQTFKMGVIQNAGYAEGRAFYPASADCVVDGAPMRKWNSASMETVTLPGVRTEACDVLVEGGGPAGIATAALSVATSFCADKTEIPLKFEEAEKRLFPVADNMVGWSQHQISRGGSTYAFSSTTEYDMDGRAVWSSWDSYSRILSGTLVAVPIGDFKVESAFVYRASPGSSCLTGLVVSVEVQLSTGAKTPNEQAMQKTVKDLACVGMALSKGNGGKPMRIMSLKKSACRRFGGKNPRPHYDAPSGRVFILMEDCKLANGDSTFVPATPEGATKGEREKLAKLHRDKNNGGVRIFTSITEIHPVGSSHIHDRIP